MNDSDKDLFAYRVKNVENEFKNLPKEGEKEKFVHMRYFTNIAFEHVQGYTQYQRDNVLKYIFTHNTTGKYGYVIIETSMNCTSKGMALPEDWNHPGGIQCMGQYLFVPCEKDDKCKIFVYDLVTNHLVKEYSYEHRAGCLGITDCYWGGRRYYVMVIGEKTTYHVYKALIDSGVQEDIANAVFNKVGSFSLKDKTFSEQKDDGKYKDHKSSIDCQGLGLITEADTENIYMLAPVQEKTNEDWIYLMKLNLEAENNVSISPKVCRHIKSYGRDVHFRWGAGIRITPAGKLAVLASGRNTFSENGHTSLDTTYWMR